MDRNKEIIQLLDASIKDAIEYHPDRLRESILSDLEEVGAVQKSVSLQKTYLIVTFSLNKVLYSKIYYYY